ncbi:hypothetical protein NIES4106_10310 [Fischerella sp. NIES-4106]|nr:hypothetical protein NIES4106_10310 [Fischerella sp. NIES-4106]
MSYEQLQLAFDIPLQQSPQTVHDPYWDELESQSTQKACDNVDQCSSQTCSCLDTINLIGCKRPSLHVDIAPQHFSNGVGAQIPLLEPQYKSVGAQVITDTRKIAPQQTQYKSVGAQVTTDTKKSAPQHDTPTHWVEKYWVERNTNKYWYYRYCWMEGRKKHRVYIGSVNSTRASQIKVAVLCAIREGESPQQIKSLIKS